MKIDAFLGAQQTCQIAQRRAQTIRHGVGAAVLNGSPYVLESIARGDLAKLLDIERIDAQVFVILEIVDRRDAMFVAQPFEIVFAGYSPTSR
jgi:hypothetical protein